MRLGAVSCGNESTWRRQVNIVALMVVESKVSTALTWVVHAAHINHNIERLDHFRVARANHIGPRKPLRLLQQEAAERLIAAAGKVQVRRRQVEQGLSGCWSLQQEAAERLVAAAEREVGQGRRDRLRGAADRCILLQQEARQCPIGQAAPGAGGSKA